MTLRALRLAAGSTQLEVSEATGIARGDVSKLERRAELDELVVSTLRRYVESVGGKLVLIVMFPAGHRITLTGYEGPDADHGRKKR